jgi:hypothetical protein
VSAFFASAVSGVMKLVLRPTVWLLASVAILATACDRDSPSNDGGDPSGGNAPIVLRGGERLGWDQPTVGGANPSSYTYIMYIDGAATPLTNVACSSSSSGFTCSSLLPRMNPGRHSLTLVASQGSAMSAPSRPLEVSVVVAATLPEQISRDEKSIAQPRCTGTDPCYRSTELLRSPGVISSPVSGLNGRILFVVDGRQIQSVAPGATAPDVLLNVDTPAARILSIAAPRSGQGDGSSLVWVTSTETRADATRVLTTTRYRLVEDTLGEGAVVVSMTIPNVEPRVVIDNDSHLFIALPSTGSTPASVWRLMADGTTPRSQNSPDFSSVPRELRAIALTPEGQLWVSGMDETGRSQLGPIESMKPDARFVSVAPAADDPQSAASDITSLAFTRSAGAGRSESLMFAVANGTLYRAPAEGSILGSMQTVPISRGTPIEVAADDGGVYVVTATTLNDGAVVYSLFRLVP